MTVTGSTPRSRVLGMRLREVREAADFSTRDLSLRIGVERSTISRWEGGSRSPTTEHVASILTACGVTGADRENILELARSTDQPHWLSVRSVDRERQMDALLRFERDANAIVDVAPLLIPGLLQTANYARAVTIESGVPATEIETQVAVRLGRREVIMRRNPARLHAFIGDTAVRQLIGGPEVLAEQLQHLLDITAYDNITVQVMPVSTGFHHGLAGPFMVIESSAKTPIVHLENQRAGLFFHELDDVESYQASVENIMKVAMSPQESREFINAVIGELETIE